MEREQKRFVVVLGVLALLISLILLKEQGMFPSNEKSRAATSGSVKTANSKALPVYCVETEKPQIAISFDAAWGNEQTQELLDILASEDVKATFFMTGSWVESYPEDVKKIYEAGHELGNHSCHHYDMTKLSAKEMQEEVMQVHNEVKELTGYDMKVFRPPYGAYNDQMVSEIRGLGYQVVQWDVDTSHTRI